MININNFKTSYTFNKNKTIKEIKDILLKKYINKQEEKNEQNKSFDNKNKNRKNYILNQSTDNNINRTHNEENSNLISKNEFNIENKDAKKDVEEMNNSTNSDINISMNRKGKHKKINLYYKGKELANEEEIIGTLISNNGSEELELSAIILFMNDSTFVDENKTKEKLIQKITEKCQFHKGNKELYICTTCGVAFCTHCENKHKNHEIIERKNIIQFNNELKLLNEELNKSLKESNLSNIYEIKESNNSNYSVNIEKLQNRIDNIKKMHKGIINNYKRDIDKNLPYLLEYKEKIEQLIESSYQLDTIKDDQQFMDYYYWYSNIKQKNLKIKQVINNLEKNRKLFNKVIEDFDEKIKSIFIKTDDDYKLLKNFYYNYNNLSYDNENQFRTMNLNTTTISSNLNNQNAPKLNLFNLLNHNNDIQDVKSTYKKEGSKDISQLSEICSIKDKEDKLSIKSLNNIGNNSNTNQNNLINKNNLFQKDINERNVKRKRFYTQRIKAKKFGNFEEIEEKSEVDESLDETNINFPKKIYNIKPKSQNIYCFDFETKKVNEILINFNNLNIETFEQYHSTLNYENNFYFSGGYNSLKLFCKYNPKENNFIQLKEMPSAHSYHGMLGMANYIFIISGLKSKKVEKYDVNNNTWEKLADLNDSRTWPSCLEYKNKYIFVFGGLFHNHIKDDNIIIEKLDIININNKWEKLIFNYNNKIKLPFYFGLVHIYDNSFLLMGGKYNSKENNMNDCYKIIIDDKKIDIKQDIDFILPKKEEFNGKMFSYFGNNFYGEFSSSSYRTFYLVNSLNKTIEEID